MFDHDEWDNHSLEAIHKDILSIEGRVWGLEERLANIINNNTNIIIDTINNNNKENHAKLMKEISSLLWLLLFVLGMILLKVW